MEFFFYVKLICCSYQNLCVTFTNILGFLLNFLTSLKNCVKGQWPKKSLFPYCWRHDLWLEAKKKEEYIWVPEILLDDLVHKGHTMFNMLTVFVVEKMKSLCSKQSKFNFWNQVHPKIAFLCLLWTQTATWRPNYTVLTSSVKATLKAMTNTVFWHQVRGGQKKFI